MRDHPKFEAIRHKREAEIQEFIQGNAYTSEDMQRENFSPVEIMLEGNNLGQHTIFFKLADQFLNLGAQLPKPKKDRNEFSTTTEYFLYLSSNYHDLYIALRANPNIVKEQDEKGKTILHYAAEIGLTMGSNSASLVLDLLFNAPNVDFNIQDNDGNTPMHCAAMSTHDRVTNQYIFPRFVFAAREKGFNFNCLNKQGLAIIHIVIIVEAYTDYVWGRRNTVQRLLEIAGDQLNKDVLSASGSTAFYYAVNRCYFPEANALLAAGASPTLFGNPDRNPLAMVTEHIDKHDTLRLKLLGLKEANEEKTIDTYLFENREFFSILMDGQQNIDDELKELAEKDFEELVNISDEHLAEATQNLHTEESLRKQFIALHEARINNTAEQHIIENRDLLVNMRYKYHLQSKVQTHILPTIDTALDDLDAWPMTLRMELFALKKAAQNNDLTQYVADHTEFLVDVLQFLDLQDKVPALLDEIDRRIGNIAKILDELKSLKEHMLSIQFTKPQECSERFSFWSRNKELAEWEKVSCQQPYDEFSGPNC